MKKIMHIAFLLLIINITKAQITFEFDHDSASTIDNNIGGIASEDQLMIVNFEVSGEQYVKVNRHGQKICIYDMSHALLKTIDYSAFPQASTANNYCIILYLSEKLFNTDVKKEFMYLANTANPYTGIYNEDGTLLFSDTGAAIILASFPSQQYPIYNTTSNGTKMILSYKNGHAKVFSLAGTLTTAIDKTSHTFAGNMGNAYPNPTANATTIPYSLPQGISNGELIFYNTQGTEVKRFKVDNTFSSLQLSTADIPAGTYYYQLQTDGNASGTKKLIVIK